MKNKAATFSPGGWREANFQRRRNYSTLPLHRAYRLTKSPPPPRGTASSSTGNPPLGPGDRAARQKRRVITSAWFTRAANSNQRPRPEVIHGRVSVRSGKRAYFSELGTARATLLSPRCAHPAVKALPTASHTRRCTATLPFSTAVHAHNPLHSSTPRLLLTTLSSAVGCEV